MSACLGSRRMQVLVLLFTVLCVPALTRATQHVCSTSLSQETGFSRSSDAAPERVTASPDIQIVDLVAIVAVQAPPLARAVMQRTDQALPASAAIPVPRPLRAPPSHVLL